MKLKIFTLLALLAVLLGLAACGQRAAPTTIATVVERKPPSAPTAVAPEPLCSPCDPPPRGCTIFTVSRGDRVFFGGNGDWINFDSNYYWVDPGDETHYGAIYFGKPDNVQQGFNEKGLAYDANGLPLAPVTDHPGREAVYGGYASYLIHILRACATVEEVIAWVQAHQ